MSLLLIIWIRDLFFLEEGEIVTMPLTRYSQKDFDLVYFCIRFGIVLITMCYICGYYALRWITNVNQYRQL